MQRLASPIRGLGGLLLGVFPAAGLFGFGLAYLLDSRGDGRSRGWMVVWGVAFGLALGHMALSLLLTGRAPVLLAAQFLLGLIASTVLVYRTRLTAYGLLLALVILSVLGSTQFLSRQWSWRALNGNQVARDLSIGGITSTISIKDYQAAARQLWHLTGTPILEFIVKARLITPENEGRAPVIVGLRWRDSVGETHLKQTLLVGDQWQEYRVIFESDLLRSVREVNIQVQAGPGAVPIALELRDPKLLAPSGRQPRRAFSPSIRAELLSPHPNFAGHAAVAIGLSAIALLPQGNLQILGGALTLVTVYVTGSRAAWLAAFLGLAALVLMSLPRLTRRFRIFLVVLLGALLTLAVVAAFLSNARVTSTRQVGTPRPHIWRLAWQATLSSPWTGLQQSFASWSGAQEDTYKPVNHAHNFVLALSSEFGLFGLAAALWLLGGFLWLSWLWGRWRGLLLLLPIILLNMPDFTLFRADVLMPTMLWMNAFREEKHSETTT